MRFYFRASPSSVWRVPGPSRFTITAFGLVQILGWGCSFYFPAVFAPAIVAETGWPLPFVVGGTSLGLLVAGLISPAVGGIIARHGGRSILAASALLFAVGLTLVGLASSLPLYLAGWIAIGLGMGTGLYDAVFATLGRMYGLAARAPITTLTLFGGFSSTICWPLSAWLLELVGWRGAALVYAALQIGLALPLMLYATRQGRAADAEPAATEAPAPHREAQPAQRMTILVLLAAIMSLAAGIGAIVIVHMLILLQARGLDFAAAVAAGTLFGPAQVGARVIERLFGARYHPLWTLAAAVALMAAGLLLFTAQAPAILAGIVVYAAGYGVSWIARGTVPLALFGAADYPRLIGRLAFPSLIVQALAPSAGAALIAAQGVNATIAALIACACLNVALTLWLVALVRR
jgi:MFS family permease